MMLCQAVDDARSRWSDIELAMPFLNVRPAFFEHPGEPFRYLTTQASPAFKHLWATGTVNVLASKFSDLARLFLPDGPLPCDVALVMVSPPGPEGKVSLGVSVGATLNPVRACSLVIAQVNKNVPYTMGAGEIPVEEFDFLVEADEPIRMARDHEGGPDAIARRIAELAAEVVPDGATLQFGIGALPDTVLANLGNRKGLKVHSGLLTDASVGLFEAGVIEGPMIVGQISSTARLLKFVHRNPNVLMAPAAFTHGCGVLGSLKGFVAINSTLEVALDGSCNSEMANGQIVSGPGGAPDFAFGAGLASGGRAIMALRSATAGGLSRIVGRIEPPNPVTLPSYLADVVVTEYGRAEVRGLAVGARAEALVALAHPDHRAALAAGAPR